MSTARVKSSGVVAPHGLKWHGRVAAAFIYFTVRAVAATLRFRVHDPYQLLGGLLQENAILCVWHNRLAVSLPIYQRLSVGRRPGLRLAALVSASRDGGLLARVLEHFEVQPVRGSSSRRGAQALLELTSWAERGYDLAITPDGPRGPRYSVQEGVIALAQLTGLPVVPVGIRIHPKVCLNSWDRFQIPVAFGRCDVILGRPLTVPRETSDAERETLRAELEQALLEEVDD